MHEFMYRYACINVCMYIHACVCMTWGASIHTCVYTIRVCIYINIHAHI